MNTYNLIVIVFLTSLFLTACETLPTADEPVPAADPVVLPTTAPQSDKVKIANQLYQQGKQREAASTYYAAGLESRSPERERLILQGIEIAAMLSDTALMDQYYRSINVSQLDRDNTARYNYTKGLMALIKKQPKIALDILPMDVRGIGAGLSNKILLTRMRAADSTGDHFLIARERIHQHSYLKQARHRESNRDQIWSHLNKLSQSQLDTERRRANNPVLRGWLDLAYLKQVSTAGTLKVNMDNWKARYPNHPAESVRLRLVRSAPSPSTSDDSSAPTSAGKVVAVLLPFNGRLGNVGKDLYQGIADAHQAMSPSTKLVKYDTSQLDASVVYNQALQEGAGFVLGPFGKENIASIARNGYLQTPVVSLNYLPATASHPNDLFQIGLLPEDEALQIAKHTTDKGLKRALVLVPDSAWGRRLENAFSMAFKSRGGEVVKRVHYPNRASNYRQNVSGLLTSAGSADMIFLAASPTQARLIYPLITKSGLEVKPPVYATSHIYSGRPAPSLDNNLNGIIYTEIPYVLSGTTVKSQYPRLYALGQDAFLISQQLAKLKSGGTIQGKTGEISASSDGRLHRVLDWAVFHEGKPTAYDP